MRQRQRFDEAQELYEQALDTAPNHARIHYELGGMLMQMGRHDEAVLALSDAVAEQPHIAEPRVSLGIALMQVRDGAGRRGGRGAVVMRVRRECA